MFPTYLGGRHKSQLSWPVTDEEECMYHISYGRKVIMSENHIGERIVRVQRGLEDPLETLRPRARVGMRRRGF